MTLDEREINKSMDGHGAREIGGSHNDKESVLLYILFHSNWLRSTSIDTYTIV